MKIHLATISHRHGLNFYTGLTEDGIYAQLKEYVRANHNEMKKPIHDQGKSDREVVEEYFQDEYVMNGAMEYLTHSEEHLGSFQMVDWAVAAGEEGDPRPWNVEFVEFDKGAIKLEFTCPDETKRDIWIEISDGNLVVHGYDPEHEEPVNMRIGKDIITVDSDRDEYDLDKIIDFAKQVARFTLPEEEDFKEKGYEDVDEYLADFSDDRLCDEYSTFMTMIREARKVLHDRLQR